MLNVLRKVALFNYRIVAMPLVYLFIFGIAAYLSTWGFFAVNRTWVAPIIINQSSERVLDITEKIMLYHTMVATQLPLTNERMANGWYEENRLIDGIMDLAHDSPYYLAATGHHDFAFVPYTNEHAIVVGAPVYDCYLEIVACYRVGTVVKVFTDEERHEHPIFFFKGSLRGFLIQIELTDPKADRDSVLFIGHKPLLF